MSSVRIGVTGATGRLGSLVARRLSDAGVTYRAIVRDPGRVSPLPGSEVATASYDDRDAFERALKGIETLFFVSASESPRRLAQHFTVIEAMTSAGVRNVIYTSFIGAAPDATFTLARDHGATEQRIRASPLGFTFLRDNLYLDFLPMMIDEGVIRGPAGHGRVAAVAQDDVADVAGIILRNATEHAGKTYELTGPVALTLHEVAAILSRHLGREVRYVEETVEEAYRSRQKYGAEPWQLDAWVSTYTAIRDGELARVTRDVENVAGHRPRALTDVVAHTGR